MDVIANASNFTTNSGTPDHYVKTLAKIAFYIVAVVIFFGLVGNSLAMAVFIKRKRGFSVDVYFLTLTILDTIAIISSSFIYFERVRGYPIVLANRYVCCSTAWLMYTSQLSSAWVLSFFSVDRLVALCFPVNAEVFCRKKRAVVVVVTVCFVSLMLNIHSFWTYGVPKVCSRDMTNETLGIIVQWCRLVLYAILPSVIILGCNIFLITSLYNIKNINIRGSVCRNTRGATSLLVGASVLFVCTSVTFTILSIYIHYTSGTLRKVLPQIVPLLTYLNHSGNFYVYILSGRLFRQDLKNLCAIKTRVSGRPAASQATDFSEVGEHSEPSHLFTVESSRKETPDVIRDGASFHRVKVTPL